MASANAAELSTLSVDSTASCPHILFGSVPVPLPINWLRDYRNSGEHYERKKRLERLLADDQSVPAPERMANQDGAIGGGDSAAECTERENA